MSDLVDMTPTNCVHWRDCIQKTKAPQCLGCSGYREAKPSESKFINKSEHKFTDISSESERVYVFPDAQVTIDEPLKLHVSESGGHRLYNSDGKSFYIPPKWIAIIWTSKENEPNFVK